MQAYRIAVGRYPLFDGTGAMNAGGRWNSPGRPVIYGSLSQGCAMLEVLAHANIGKLPKHSEMIVINIPDDVSIENLDPNNLPGWDHPNNLASCQYGDDWINSARTAVLIVPSVIAPYDRNIVINQRHPEFSRITASPQTPVAWDIRLQQLVGGKPLKKKKKKK